MGIPLSANYSDRTMNMLSTSSQHAVIHIKFRKRHKSRAAAGCQQSETTYVAYSRLRVKAKYKNAFSVGLFFSDMPEKEFKFHYEEGRDSYVLRAPVSIPLSECTAEFTARLIHAHNLPCYLEEDLEKALSQFVREEERTYCDDVAVKAIERVRAGEQDVGCLVDAWSNVFIQESLAHRKLSEVTNEAVFSEIYHSLIHSSALGSLLNLEQTYALSMTDIISERDKDLLHLEQRQAEEMEQAVKHLGTTFTDEQINQLAQRHFDNTQMIESKWASEISSLRDTQKREYRQWVMNVNEDMQANPTTPPYVHQVRLSNNDTFQQSVDAEASSMRRMDSVMPQRREESFTVHLGAQMKTMHNLCLVSTDILSLCRHKLTKDGGGWMTEPQRLQTAISLYSDSLCGLVMLVDNRLNAYTGIKRDFARVCEQSTDFHFPDLEQQFEDVEVCVSEGSHWRASLRQSAGSVDDGDKVSLQSTASSSGSEREDKSCQLYPGDFYMTRHSNLAQVHAVFHLVADDSVRSSVSDVSSRHPVLLGIRNILKACFRYDINTVTLPLLLVHEMAEEMTIPWCMKRAELVLKCVKGFIMELATWSGQKSCTIQFLVPSMLSDETLSSISAMIPSIFRMSNPVVHKTSNNSSKISS